MMNVIPFLYCGIRFFTGSLFGSRVEKILGFYLFLICLWGGVSYCKKWILPLQTFRFGQCFSCLSLFVQFLALFSFLLGTACPLLLSCNSFSYQHNSCFLSKKKKYGQPFQWQSQQEYNLHHIFRCRYICHYQICQAVRHNIKD